MTLTASNFPPLTLPHLLPVLRHPSPLIIPGMELINCLLSARSPPPASHVTTKFKLSNEQISSLKSQRKEGRVSSFHLLCCLLHFFGCATALLKNFLPALRHTSSFLKVIRISAAAQVSQVTSSPIQIVANTVKSVINGFMDEFIRSFIDCVEVNKDKGLFLAKTLPKSDLRIISNCGMPVYDTDFGWGAPQVVIDLEWVSWKQSCFHSEQTGKRCWYSSNVSLDSDIMQKFGKLFHEKLGCNSLQS